MDWIYHFARVPVPDQVVRSAVGFQYPWFLPYPNSRIWQR